MVCCGCTLVMLSSFLITMYSIMVHDMIRLLRMFVKLVLLPGKEIAHLHGLPNAFSVDFLNFLKGICSKEVMISLYYHHNAQGVAAGQCRPTCRAEAWRVGSGHGCAGPFF